jgi:hypothetical protein
MEIQNFGDLNVYNIISHKISGGNVGVGINRDIILDASDSSGTSNITATLKCDDGINPWSYLSFSRSTLLENVATPISATDAANKQYIDTLLAGLSLKYNVSAVSTTQHISSSTDTTLTVSFSDATHPQTLAYGNINDTDTTAGTITFNGILIGETNGNSERILFKNQTTEKDNGIYYIKNSTTDITKTGTGPYTYTIIFTRAPDSDDVSLDAVRVGNFAFNEADGVGWVLSSTSGSFGNVIVGVDTQIWTQFSSGSTYVGGDGILIDGSNISVDLETSGLLGIVSGKLQVNQDCGISVKSGMSLVSSSNVSTDKPTFSFSVGPSNGADDIMTNTNVISTNSNFNGAFGSEYNGGGIQLGNTPNINNNFSQGLYYGNPSTKNTTRTITKRIDADNVEMYVQKRGDSSWINMMVLT